MLVCLKTVISASRRTDIPAFYMPWFMERLQEGCFEVINPYNNHLKIVSAGPSQVHSIVFWSKNFGPFIDGDYGVRLEEMGYHLFFNFTINSTVPILEPTVPSLGKRIEQLAALSKQFGSRAITWRFDPLSFFSTGDGFVEDNLADFSEIAAGSKFLIHLFSLAIIVVLISILFGKRLIHKNKKTKLSTALL